MNVLNEYRVVARLLLCHDDLETDGTQIKQTKRDRAPQNQPNAKTKQKRREKNHLVGQKRELDDNRIAAAGTRTNRQATKATRQKQCKRKYGYK